MVVVYWCKFLLMVWNWELYWELLKGVKVMIEVLRRVMIWLGNK